MTADELFKAGQLSEALAEQTQLVKKSPTDSDARFMLFVLLCFAGEVERAGKQLEVLASQDEGVRQGALVYHSLLQAEYDRQQVYAGRSEPVLPPDAPSHMATRADALRRLASSDVASVAASLEQAASETEAVSGALDGAAFADLRDDDDLLGPIFEVFAGGRYLWIPNGRLRSLELSPPTTALDTLWRQARLEELDGTVAEVHLPVLYAGSGAHPDDAVRLGRVTEWLETAEVFLGRGQRLWVSDVGGERVETPILDVSRIEFGSGD